MLRYCPYVVHEAKLLRVATRQACRHIIRYHGASKRVSRNDGYLEHMLYLQSASQTAGRYVQELHEALEVVCAVNELPPLEERLVRVLMDPSRYFKWFCIVQKYKNTRLARASPFSLASLATYLQVSRYEVRKAAQSLRRRVARLEGGELSAYIG